MQKTRMGITVGLFGAAIYFAGLFSGYLIMIIMAGYVLLFEENAWLKRTAVKSVTLMVLFSFISLLINLLPDAMRCIGYIASMFGGNFYIGFLSDLVNAVISVIDIVEKILFIGLGVKALNQGTIILPVVDKMINKYMG